MPFDLAALGGKKKTLAIAGVGGAVVLGLYARSKKKIASTSSAGGTDASSSPTLNGATIQPATYENIASDLYGALEPQLEQMQQSITNLQNSPAPNPPPGSTPAAPSNLDQLGKALAAATPEQHIAWGTMVANPAAFQNLVAWQNAHPGQDFTQATWGMFHPHTPYSPAAAATVAKGGYVP